MYLNSHRGAVRLFHQPKGQPCRGQAFRPIFPLPIDILLETRLGSPDSLEEFIQIEATRGLKEIHFPAIWPLVNNCDNLIAAENLSGCVRVIDSSEDFYLK